MQTRNGLIVDAELLETNGRVKCDAARMDLELVPGDGHITVAGDKGFDIREFVAECRHMDVTPNTGRAGGSTIGARTTQ